MATVEHTCATRVSPKRKTGTKGKSPEREAVPGFTIKSRMNNVKVCYFNTIYAVFSQSTIVSLMCVLHETC